MKKFEVNMLDGSSKAEDKIMKEFLDSFTEEENKRAMSSEFDYLEEGLDFDESKK